MPQIEMRDVVKDYRIRARDPERSRALELVSPRHEARRALDGLSMRVEPGEMVGLIGPNGAGKSTAIKLLTGILTPTSGVVRVLRRDPVAGRAKNAARMGVVFGQRSQLLWDLPVRDTLELHKTMYRIPDAEFSKQKGALIDMLDAAPFLDRPVRQLSLGQRMRANLLLCFLHRPEVVYLDEPTIGLDVLVKDGIRAFLSQVNREQGTTVLLTTHDTGDIEQVARRLMLIDKGKLLFDGDQPSFRQTYQGDSFSLEVEFAREQPPIEHPALEPQSIEGAKHRYRVRYAALSHGEAISLAAGWRPVSDIRVREAGLDDILKQVYRSTQIE